MRLSNRNCVSPVRPRPSPRRPLCDGTPLIRGKIAINVFYVGFVSTSKSSGHSAGLDSFAPEFTTYWMTILYIMSRSN